MNRGTKIVLARALRKEGVSYAAIGRKLGHNASVIQKWLDPEAKRKYNRRDNARRREYKTRWQAQYRAKLKKAA